MAIPKADVAEIEAPFFGAVRSGPSCSNGHLPYAHPVNSRPVTDTCNLSLYWREGDLHCTNARR